MLKINSSVEMELKYDSLYSGLVSINKSLGGTQSMPDSEYGAMIDLMETLSGQPVGESGDAFDAVSTVATMAENGELPIQMKLDSVDVDITANGRYEYRPDAYGLDGFSGFVANVNVPDSSRLGVKSVNISENGHQEFHAIDFDLDGFSTIGIDVNVPTGGGGTKINVGELGLKFGNSTFSTVPDIFDFSKVTDTKSMFYGCKNLLSIPQFDTSKATDMGHMFYFCTSLQSIPLLNTSNVTYMGSVFQDCRVLTTIPQLDTSNVTSVDNMFMGCDALESIPLLDCGKVTSAYAIINPSYYDDQVHLTDMGGFKNIKISFDIQRAPNLTVQSLMNVINNLYDFVGNGSTTTKTLTLGTTNLNKLTEEQKAVATNKGWQLK